MTQSLRAITTDNNGRLVAIQGAVQDLGAKLDALSQQVAALANAQATQAALTQAQQTLSDLQLQLLQLQESVG